MHSNMMYVTATQQSHNNNNQTSMVNIRNSNLFTTTSFRSPLSNQNTFRCHPSNVQNIRWSPPKMSQYAQDIRSNSSFNNRFVQQNNNYNPPQIRPSYINNQQTVQQNNGVNQGNNNNQNGNYRINQQRMQAKIIREIIAIKQLHFVRRYDRKTDHQMPWHEKQNNNDDNTNGQHKSATDPILTLESILNDRTDDDDKSDNIEISESPESVLNDRADDGYNDSQESKSSDYSLNGEAVEFIPVIQNIDRELLSLLTSLLNDALFAGDTNTTLSSIICREKLMDKKYFGALFQAIQSVFVQVLVNKLGHVLIKELLTHCDEQQKLVLVINLTCNIVEIACNHYGYLSTMEIMNTLSTIQQIKCFVDGLRGNIKILGTVEYGVRVIKAYFDKETMNGKMNVVLAILKNIDILIQNEFGWYIFYNLLHYNPSIKITDGIKQKLYNKYALYSKQEFSSKVIEECLRHSIKQNDKKIDTKKDWATIIVQEILSKTDDLMTDIYGKYVFHLAYLSKVPGINGDNLSSLKHYANTKYLKHIKKIRMKSFYKFDHDDDDEEEEMYKKSCFNVYQNEMKNSVLEYMKYPEFS